MSVNDAQQPLLVFSVAQRAYALPIAAVVEVAALVAWVALPHAPPAILGYANRHGEALLMLDLGHILGDAPCTTTLSTFFVVMAAAGQQVGLVVEAIMGVRYIPEAHIRPAPHTPYVRAIVSQPEQLIQILSPEALLMAYPVEAPSHNQT